jgi:hypothetical protein
VLDAWGDVRPDPVSAVDDDPPLTLAQLLDRSAWHADALCVEHPELDWFVGRGVSVGRQRAICARCAVRTECLADALDRQDQFGLWGGLTLAERRRLTAAAA